MMPFASDDVLLVTAVVPVWNMPPDIVTECVESLQAQDVSLRIIVVDNRSDTPVEVPRAPNLDIVRLPERVSVGHARNAGLALVTTPYVLFMDADDKLAVGTVRYLLGRLRDHRFVVATGGIVRWNPRTGIRVPARWPPDFVFRFHSRWRLLMLATLLRCVFPTVNSVLFRTDVVRAAGGYGRGNRGEDWMLGYSLTLRGGVKLGRRECHLSRIDQDRLTLDADQSWWAGYRMRRDFRRHVRDDPLTPLYVRLALPVVAAIHLAYAFQEAGGVHELGDRVNRRLRRGKQQPGG